MKRRNFLRHSGVAMGGSWISMSVPTILLVACKARETGSIFKCLTTVEAAEFEAIAAQIVPSDDSPGATEAGVIYFMDAALADSRSEVLESMRLGLEGLKEELRNSYNTETFSSLDHARQIELLKSIQDTPFFATIRYLTLAGMFSNPSYGGNRDGIGWKLIGFEAPHPTQSPFGYYDADYIKRGA